MLYYQRTVRTPLSSLLKPCKPGLQTCTSQYCEAVVRCAPTSHLHHVVAPCLILVAQTACHMGTCSTSMLHAARGRLALELPCLQVFFRMHFCQQASLGAKLPEALGLTCLYLCTGLAISGEPAGGAHEQSTADVLEAAQHGTAVTLNMQA